MRPCHSAGSPHLDTSTAAATIGLHNRITSRQNRQKLCQANWSACSLSLLEYQPWLQSVITNLCVCKCQNLMLSSWKYIFYTGASVFFTAQESAVLSLVQKSQEQSSQKAAFESSHTWCQYLVKTKNVYNSFGTVCFHTWVDQTVNTTPKFLS